MSENTDVELKNKVLNVLEQIRPYLQADGGDLQFVNITEDLVVNVELQGACGSCPYSTMTLNKKQFLIIWNLILE